MYQQCDLLNNNGCIEGEECRYSSEDGAPRCVCKAGYIQDQLGNCVGKGLLYVSFINYEFDQMENKRMIVKICE